MNVLPTAIELLADPSVTRRSSAGVSSRRASQPRTGRRSPQLPLALPLVRRSDNRPPAPGNAPAATPPPALDAVAAAGALWSGLGAAGAVTRLDAPDDGWPDALVHPGDAVLVLTGGPVAEGALAALSVRGTNTTQLRRVHRSGDLHLRLQPEDRSVPPLILPTADVDLIGPVLTIVRHSPTQPATRRRTA